MTMKIGSGRVKAQDIAVVWEPVYNIQSASYKIGVHLKCGVRVYGSFETKDKAWEFHAKIMKFWINIQVPVFSSPM